MGTSAGVAGLQGSVAYLLGFPKFTEDASALLLSSLFGHSAVELPATVSSCDDVMLYECDEPELEDDSADECEGGLALGDSRTQSTYQYPWPSPSKYSRFNAWDDEEPMFASAEDRLSTANANFDVQAYPVDDAIPHPQFDENLWNLANTASPDSFSLAAYSSKRNLSDLDADTEFFDEVGLDLNAYPDDVVPAPGPAAVPVSEEEPLSMDRRKSRKKRKNLHVKRGAVPKEEAEEPAAEREKPVMPKSSSKANDKSVEKNGRPRSKLSTSVTLPSDVTVDEEETGGNEKQKPEKRGGRKAPLHRTISTRGSKTTKKEGPPVSAIPARVRSALTVEFDRRKRSGQKEVNANLPDEPILAPFPGVAEQGSLAPRRSTRQANRNARALPTTTMETEEPETDVHSTSSDETSHSLSPNAKDSSRFHLHYRRKEVIGKITKLLRNKKKVSVNSIRKKLELLQTVA